jgi:predicted RNA binding protein YcfA (HicA-like mRNA interferase family)
LPKKVREVIAEIEAAGWVFARQKGSHRHYRHSIKRGIVTIAGKRNDDMAPGTYNTILRQAGLKK